MRYPPPAHPLVENPGIEVNRDYNDYCSYVHGKNVVTINAEGRAGWTSHEEGFPTLPDQKIRTATHRRTVSGVDRASPIALEKNFQASADYARLSDGFKRVLCVAGSDKKMAVPVVGYAGHQKGVKARNFYGKSFRESSLASKRVLRQTLSP